MTCFIKIILCLYVSCMPWALYGWTAPTQVSSTGINFNSNASISVSGNAEVVWVNGSYPNLLIESSTYSAGSWSLPVSITSLGIHDVPKVAMDSTGNAAAVWLSNSLGNVTINSSTKPLGGTWSVPTVISTSPINYNPSIVMNDAGQAIAGWVNFQNNSVEVAHLTFGGSWSPPITLSNTPGLKVQLQIGLDSSGNGFAVWQDVIGQDIYATNSSGISWNTPVCIDSNGNNSDPSLSVGGVGQALVSWINQEVQEIKATWYSGGSWSLTPVTISKDNVDIPSSGAVGGDGFVAWQDRATSIIQCIDYFSNVWQYPPANISPPSNTASPVLSVNSTNSAIIIWPNFDNGSIEAAAFPSGGVPGSPQTISLIGDACFNPDCTSAGTNTIASWETASGSDWLIFVNID